MKVTEINTGFQRGKTEVPKPDKFESPRNNNKSTVQASIKVFEQPKQIPAQKSFESPKAQVNSVKAMAAMFEQNL